MPQNQVLPGSPGFGALLGQALGQGVSQGLSSSLNAHLERKKQQGQIQDLLKMFGGSSSTQDRSIDSLSSPSQTQGPQDNAQGLNLTPESAVVTSIAFPKLAPVVSALYQDQQKEKRFQKESNEKAIDRSFDLHKDFIKDTTSSYRAFETETKPRLLQMQNLDDGSLIKPTAAAFLDKLGIPLGSLENPGNELYQKLSQDLLKGLPETYGSRILKVEVDNFLKTIPQLTNSSNGRRMIATNMLKLGQMKETFYNEMRKQEFDYLEKNKPLPRDFEQKVFDNVKPQIDKFNKQFVELSNIRDVPENTVPFFNPQGQISFVPKDPEAINWAEKNGGERIW